MMFRLFPLVIQHSIYCIIWLISPLIRSASHWLAEDVLTHHFKPLLEYEHVWSWYVYIHSSYSSKLNTQVLCANSGRDWITIIPVSPCLALERLQIPANRNVNFLRTPPTSIPLMMQVYIHWEIRSLCKSRITSTVWFTVVTFQLWKAVHQKWHMEAAHSSSLPKNVNFIQDLCQYFWIYHTVYTIKTSALAISQGVKDSSVQ